MPHVLSKSYQKEIKSYRRRKVFSRRMTLSSLKFLYPRRAEFNKACRQNGLMPSVVMTILADGVIGGVFVIETLKASQKLILDDRRERATKRLLENRYRGIDKSTTGDTID